jgi:hypothetical protein
VTNVSEKWTDEVLDVHHGGVYLYTVFCMGQTGLKIMTATAVVLA